ncbi:MAG: hypothetical protein R2848_10380 [Thermomicrobiales bacterium]
MGRVTGEMHVALASAPEISPLAPEPISDADIRSWRAAFLRSAEETDWITGERRALPDRSRQAAAGLRALAIGTNARLVRIALRALQDECMVTITSGGCWSPKDGRLLVVDFEGEPHRLTYERSGLPLRDVGECCGRSTALLVSSPVPT